MNDSTLQPQKQPLSLLELHEKYPDIDAPLLAKVATGELSIERVKTLWTTQELLTAIFPAIVWIIEGIIGEGLTILAGRPKVGKSWLILQFLKAISAGCEVFGRTCQKRKCLYLALEDTPRRLMARIKKQNWTESSNVDFKTSLSRPLDNGGLKWLESEIDKNGYQLVVIDTISRAISAKVRQNDVADTTKVYHALQTLALTKNCSIILIDHFKKPGAKDVNDVIDEVSGSTGKTGVADTTIGIFKKRNQPSAQLKITGRDIDEADLTIEFQKEDCTWKLLGDTGEVIDSRSSQKLLDTVNELGDKATSANLEAKLKWSKSYISKILSRLEDSGRIIKGGRNEPHKVVDIDAELYQFLTETGKNGNKK